jgi:hypothetical protein
MAEKRLFQGIKSERISEIGDCVHLAALLDVPLRHPAMARKRGRFQVRNPDRIPKFLPAVIGLVVDHSPSVSPGGVR